MSNIDRVPDYPPARDYTEILVRKYYYGEISSINIKFVSMVAIFAVISFKVARMHFKNTCSTRMENMFAPWI